MTIQSAVNNGAGSIKVLIADDSPAFRRVLKDILEKSSRIDTILEATNGIEALDTILKLRPDVIIMDMEMPTMDGMTALQHLMIHVPTPTIVFSSITKECTARAFDTLKNGAVDFLCKETFFKRKNVGQLEETIIRKVIQASSIIVHSMEPMMPDVNALLQTTPVVQTIVFCEECGHKELIDTSTDYTKIKLICSQCGDPLDTAIEDRFRRIHYVSVLGAGEGGYSNLLNIVPQITPDMGGVMFLVINDLPQHVDSFAEYLDAMSRMRVLRVTEELNITGGNCYVLSGEERYYLKPYDTYTTLKKIEPGQVSFTTLDLIMGSAASAFKTKVNGIILSGAGDDGLKGAKAIRNHGGKLMVLHGHDCINTQLRDTVVANCSQVEELGEQDMAERIEFIHNEDNVATSAV